MHFWLLSLDISYVMLNSSQTSLNGRCWRSWRRRWRLIFDWNLWMFAIICWSGGGSLIWYKLALPRGACDSTFSPLGSHCKPWQCETEEFQMDWHSYQESTIIRQWCHNSDREDKRTLVATWYRTLAIYGVKSEWFPFHGYTLNVNILCRIRMEEGGLWPEENIPLSREHHDHKWFLWLSSFCLW